MIGKHSLVKDKEAQVAVVRSNHHLRESLHKVNSCLNKYNMYTQEREHVFSCYTTAVRSNNRSTA